MSISASFKGSGPCQVERIIEHLVLQRHWFKENSGNLYCYGFTLWKRGYVRSFLRSPWNKIKFIRSTKQLQNHLPDSEARLIVWGAKDPAELREFAHKNEIPIWRMEDGFLRSVSLGSDFTAPASLVVDKQGIYFDPNHTSDIESLLQTHEFTEQDIERAKTLRESITSSGLSKYNVGLNKPLVHHAKLGQRVILVPGQVEDDASIRLGCRDIRTNAQLIHAVRQKCPEAYIIYKPHPDVLSGNRKSAAIECDPQDYDQRVTDISLPQCLDAVDEVHTMTSLVGFEGLLRGKNTVTYGLPFYAGWGLTDDYYDIPDRSRRLTLNRLIAGCLIYYPRYFNHHKHHFTKPEIVIRQLTEQRKISSSYRQVSSRWLIRQMRKTIHLINSFLYYR